MGICAWLGTARASRSPPRSRVAVVVGVPVTIAVLHQGFPVTDPDLRARDVWVTNGEELLAGRLNRQIEELDAAVGDRVERRRRVAGRRRRLPARPRASARSSASTRRSRPCRSASTCRSDREVAYGGDVIAILSPKGELWVDRRPAATAAVRRGGHRPDRRARRRRPRGRERPTAPSSRRPPKTTSCCASTGRRRAHRQALPTLGAHQLAAVGERAVVLDEATRRRARRRREVALPEPPGSSCSSRAPSTTSAYVAGGGRALARVPLGGGDARSRSRATPRRRPRAPPTRSPRRCSSTAARTRAWATSVAYLAACDGREPALADDRPADRRGRDSSSASTATSSC